jgi:hypothetical protein
MPWKESSIMSQRQLEGFQAQGQMDKVEYGI